MNASGAAYRMMRVKELSGLCQFRVDPDHMGVDEEWFAKDHDPAGWPEMTVPGAWDLYDQGLWSYEGVCWYATAIPTGMVETSSWQRVHFERVSIHAGVWLNSHFLGKHIGGFLPFRFAVSPYLSTEAPNRLVVRVDNVRRTSWLPGGAKVEWMQYGGIVQPVWLLTTDLTYVSDFGIVAVPEGQGARVCCEVEITNRGGDGVSGTALALSPPGCASGSCDRLSRCQQPSF